MVSGPGTEDGVTRTGRSAFFEVLAGGSVDVPSITFGSVDPTPASLELTAPVTMLGALGETVQLVAEAIFPDGSAQTVTQAGTTFRTSNPAIASVDVGGLVTAEASGTVLLSALHEGSLAVLQIQVVLAGDADGDGLPDDLELANGLDPANSTDAIGDPDGDGLSTLEELLTHGTDHDLADTDGDQINDGEEVVAGADGYVTSPLLADTDGDGLRDGLEIATGTDPTDSASYDLGATLVSIAFEAAAFSLETGPFEGDVSRLLRVVGQLIDGFSVDLTSAARGTGYGTSDPLVCSFGGADGEVFAGENGVCAITATNNGFSAQSMGTVSPFVPAPTGFVVIPGHANGVAVRGDFAFVAAGARGLQVVDVSNRAAPVLAAELDTPGNANDLALRGDLLWIADGVGGLQGVDISDPLAPVLVGSADTEGLALDLALHGSLALIADGARGLQVFDIATPFAPVHLGGHNFGPAGNSCGVAVSDDGLLAAVADGTSGLRVVDLSDPALPVVLGTVDTGNARDVVLRGNRAFVADTETSFTEVDLSIPALPSVAYTEDPASGGRLFDLGQHGRFAFGADLFFVNSVPVMEIEGPAAPRYLGQIDFSALRDDNGTGIEADGAYVYLTATQGPEDNQASGNSRLYIGQYRPLGDENGQAPGVALTAPAVGASGIAGATVALRAAATDDKAVAAVEFLVDAQVVFVDSTEPFEHSFQLPSTPGLLTLGARAVDLGGSSALAQELAFTVTADPGTDLDGFVVDGTGTPVSGAEVRCLGISTLSAFDGYFLIEDVPAVGGAIRCTAARQQLIPGGATLFGRSVPRQRVVAGATDFGLLEVTDGGPILQETGWQLERVEPMSNARSALEHPVDGHLYLVRRISPADGGGLYRIDANGSVRLVAAADLPAAVGVDPLSGDLFVAEDFSGEIFRTAFGEIGREVWVSGLHAGDDDPTGIEVAPPDYVGGVVLPGEALVTDRGHMGRDEIWTFSPTAPGGEQVVHVDNVSSPSILVDAVDLAIDASNVWVIDTGGNGAGQIYLLDSGGGLSTLITSQPLSSPTGAAIDPLTGDLLVLDAGDSRLVRIDPSTGTLTEVVTGFGSAASQWSGVDLSADGNRLTVSGATAIFVYRR